MPFTVYKNTQGWKIKKPSENKIYPQVFKTKNSASNMAKNWMRYRHERKGGFITSNAQLTRQYEYFKRTGKYLPRGPFWA